MALTGLIRSFYTRGDKWNFEHQRRIRQASTVFIHIPKTAGTAFTHCLAGAIGSGSSLSGCDHSVFGAFDQFDTMRPETRALIYGPADPVPTNAELVAGHFAISTVRRFYPKANYCTVLREPESRLLSHWLFWRQHSDEELAAWGAPWSARVRRARCSLVDFLRDPEIACQTDNIALRMLLWPDPRVPSKGFIQEDRHEALLENAIAALQKFDWIDFIENPDFVANVEKWIGAPFVLKRMNETRQASAEFPVDLRREMTAEARALLKMRSRLDLVLWDEVVKRRRLSNSSSSVREAAFRSTLERHACLQKQLVCGS